MKKLYLFLDTIPPAKRRVLLLVVVSLVIFPVLTNLLFLSERLKAVFQNQIYTLCLGLVVYGLWLLLLNFLQKQDRVSLKNLSLGKEDIKKGLVAGLALYVITNAWLVGSTLLRGENLILSKGFSSPEFILTAISIFFLNIFVGAFIEEVLIRSYMLPQAFRVVRKSAHNKLVALLIAVILTQALFAIAHVPADLFRFNLDLADLLSRQQYLFLSGIVYALVYLRTRNVVFLSLYHAFMNYGMPIINTEAFVATNYNIVMLVLLLFWGRIMPSGKTKNQLQPDLIFPR